MCVYSARKKNTIMVDNPTGSVIGCSLKKRKKDQEEMNERTKKIINSI